MFTQVGVETPLFLRPTHSLTLTHSFGAVLNMEKGVEVVVGGVPPADYKLDPTKTRGALCKLQNEPYTPPQHPHPPVSWGGGGTHGSLL